MNWEKDIWLLDLKKFFSPCSCTCNLPFSFLHLQHPDMMLWKEFFYSPSFEIVFKFHILKFSNLRFQYVLSFRILLWWWWYMMIASIGSMLYTLLRKSLSGDEIYISRYPLSSQLLWGKSKIMGNFWTHINSFFSVRRSLHQSIQGVGKGRESKKYWLSVYSVI